MKLDSKWFDCIRIAPRQRRPARDGLPACEAPGCNRPAPHRAPKGRLREGEYFHFCIDHVRDYNRSYNWFAGMSDDDVAAWMASGATGHRPTWSMGANGRAQDAGHAHAFSAEFFIDPFDFFGGVAASAPEDGRRIGNAERRSLEALGLDETATGADIKARYKELVKRHHPDANGGDRSKEGRLRQIIEAYATLRTSGFYRDC
jgi:hypothetical protein